MVVEFAGSTEDLSLIPISGSLCETHDVPHCYNTDASGVKHLADSQARRNLVTFTFT